ncbi:uncharacterized protein LOC114363492 isoform X2 [Ostrinia furnacalis]|uniref:uncharacterized protein LOC114363492 isoform X2 n=1 Tax=Ostrinia furnacalis TaxID=93504 RepID=UPI0010408DDE|nr:uncharacterized protein LOC114363492 isoform X2 [Ostrinia furnacalis]
MSKVNVKSNDWMLVEKKDITRAVVHSREVRNILGVKCGSSVIIKDGDGPIRTVLVARPNRRRIPVEEPKERDDPLEDIAENITEGFDFEPSSSDWEPSDVDDVSDSDYEDERKRRKLNTPKRQGAKKPEPVPKNVLNPSNKDNIKAAVGCRTSRKQPAPRRLVVSPDGKVQAVVAMPKKTNLNNKAQPVTPNTTNQEPPATPENAVNQLPKELPTSEKKTVRFSLPPSDQLRRSPKYVCKKIPRSNWSKAQLRKKPRKLVQNESNQMNIDDRESRQVQQDDTVNVSMNIKTFKNFCRSIRSVEKVYGRSMKVLPQPLRKKFGKTGMKKVFMVAKNLRRMKQIKKTNNKPNNTTKEQDKTIQDKTNDTNGEAQNCNEENANENVENENVENENMEVFDRSDDNILISNQFENIDAPTHSPIDDSLVPIGSGKTLLPKDKFRKIKWQSYTVATRGLLLAAFSRKVLATHSLTGKKSPAFLHKPAKMLLDPKKVSDIVIEVVDRFDVKENMVRLVWRVSVFRHYQNSHDLVVPYCSYHDGCSATGTRTVSASPTTDCSKRVNHFCHV